MSNPLDTTPYSQDAGASAQSRMELQAKLNGLGGLNGRKLSPEAKEKKLREACEGFESIFIQKMWQEMRNTVPKSGLLQSKEEHFWQDMYDQELSKSMTRAGGIGLADMMFEQLSRNLVSASRSSIGQSGMGAFTPEAAPLAGPAAEPAPAPADAPKAAPAASIYEAEAPQMAEAAGAAPDAASEAAGLLAGKAAANMHAAAAMAAQTSAQAQSAPQDPALKAEKARASAPDENSGLHLSYMAKRDAGDKLGSRAIRPSMRPRRQSAQKEAAAAEPAARQQPTAAPGSAEGLAAALEKARAGAAGISGGESERLRGIVAQAQARNAAGALNAAAAGAPVSQPAPAEAAAQPAPVQAESAQAEPKVTKVRFTTNVPPSGKGAKGPKKSDVIRMLNADGAGPNSKAGQGLAAYHAAQEAAKAESASKAAQGGAQAAPISPLTAGSIEKGGREDSSGFAIPPLKAGA